MSLRCESCKFDNPEGFRFCGNCGGLLATARPVALQGERRHLTLMFCDLVGSTALSESLDPEDFRETVNEYLEAVGGVTGQFHGYIGNYMGDGMLIYFGYPTAREDAPVLAVRAALAMLDAIKSLNQKRHAESAVPLQLRIGVHSGLLVVGELGSAERKDSAVVIGRTPNLAARLQSLARPGSVVVSADTWKLIRAIFDGDLLGKFELKGIADPVAAYEVHAEKEGTSLAQGNAPAVPMVGREAEMDAVRAGWARVKAGEHWKVLVLGEPGIGKSRLVQAMEQQVAQEGGHVISVRGRSNAQSSAFQPLIDMMRDEIGTERADSVEQLYERITRFANKWKLNAPDTPRVLGDLLRLPTVPHSGLPLTALRVRLFELVPEMIRRMAERRPVVLLVEDLHWLDPSTVEALQRLVDSGPISRVMMICTSRPEHSPAWLQAQCIDLTRLSISRTLQLIDHLVDGKDLPFEVTQQIVKKAGGIPLFIEEMTRNAIESGMLVPRGDHYEFAGASRTMAIPDTLHALLMTRLDRLNTARVTAQVAAVIGPEFHMDMLRELRGENGALDEQVSQLIEAGLVAPADSAGHYVFRHALLHAEAYDSLLKRTRRDYHRRIAALLTTRHVGTMHPEIVAHHYTEAGLNEEAVRFWLQAALLSADRAAGGEALEQTGRGLALLALLGDQRERRKLEMDLMSVRGRAATMVKGYGAPEVAASFARVSELCREIDEHPGQAEALSAIFAYHIARADYPAALATAREMERLGAREMTWLSLGTHAYYTGELAYCVSCMQRCIDEYEAFSGPRPMRGLDAKVASLGWSGMAQLMLGRPDLSRCLLQEAVSFSRRLELAHSEAFAMLLRQSHDFWMDDPQAVLDGMEEHLAVCRQQAFTYFLTLSMVLEGWARFRLQPDARHAETIERGLHGWRRTGALLAASQHEAALVEVYTSLGQHDKAGAYLESSCTHVVSSGERIYAPLLSHLKAQLLLRFAPEDAPRIEACFRESLAQARGIKARWHELRPIMGLVNLLRNQGREEEARIELTAVLDLFTPEMDAPVLAQARELLG